MSRSNAPTTSRHGIRRRADGMRARLVDIDFQPLEQRVANVLVTKVLAVGQDERERHIHSDPIPGPATEMTSAGFGERRSSACGRRFPPPGSRCLLVAAPLHRPDRGGRHTIGSQPAPALRDASASTVGKRQTVPEPARGTRLKEDEDLSLLDHRVADASQKVRLADSRPPLDDEVTDRHAVAQPGRAHPGPWPNTDA